MANNPYEELKKKWWKWHKQNPEVCELFDKFTLHAIKRGHKHLSAWLIINRVRWETSVVTYGDPFKISNEYIAMYARYFMHRYPEYEGFFRTKKMYGEHDE
jgi:hypothetical protein